MLDIRLLNRHLGRKWTIFWTCLISAVTCIWQGFVNNWWHLFIARFFLGFGIGVKSATVPAYAAECTPKHVRGALVMLWQFFTAVGIMFGFVSALAFYYVPHKSFGTGLNWRLMLDPPVSHPSLSYSKSPLCQNHLVG